MLPAGIVQIPMRHVAFGTVSLSWPEWLLVTGLAASIVPVLETAKALQRRQWSCKARRQTPVLGYLADGCVLTASEAFAEERRG